MAYSKLFANEQLTSKTTFPARYLWSPHDHLYSAEILKPSLQVCRILLQKSRAAARVPILACINVCIVPGFALCQDVQSSTPSPDRTPTTAPTLYLPLCSFPSVASSLCLPGRSFLFRATDQPGIASQPPRLLGCPILTQRFPAPVCPGSIIKLIPGP